VRLIVGLGNPGAEYAATRHNLGFRVADEFARRHGLEFRRGRGRAPSLMAHGVVAGQGVIVMKPLTNMNGSGVAVWAAAAFYKLGPADVLVVHDEMDLPLGAVRVIAQGGDGGHNGPRSVIAHLRTDAIARVQVGIGRPNVGAAVDHVLGAFRPDERPLVDEAIGVAADAVELILADGVAAAMERYNGGKLSRPLLGRLGEMNQ
jgi:PTH1 family peptidyl-tRNA hydrolase